MGEVQLPCARSNSFLDHKRRRRSTTRWIRGRSIKRSLPLRVWVHPQLQFTHQQLLQYTALLPRAHRTETVAALRDYGNLREGQKEKLWREFFLDPSQWWDHRSEKANERYPDFKHKETQEAL